MKKLFSFAILLLFAACTGRTYTDHSYRSDCFEQPEKAVVVLKMTGISSLIGVIPKVSFDLVLVDEETYKPIKFYHISPTFFQRLNPWKVRRECLLVDPGFYLIDHISWTVGNTTFKTGESLIVRAPFIEWGGFYAKGGAVNYVGDLEIGTTTKNALTVQHVYRVEEARKELEEQDPSLTHRLTKAPFFPGGSVMPREKIYRN